MSATDVLAGVRITAVWRALGGGELRHGRGKAFWRDGDGWNVSLSDAKGAWFDHRDGIGGGVLDLVAHVRGGARQDALRWCADLAGVPLDAKPLSAADKHLWAVRCREAERVEREAGYFVDAAHAMAELALQEMPMDDPQRSEMTLFLNALRLAPEYEYRRWLERNPTWAWALVKAGRQYQRRVQTMLANFIVGEVADGRTA
jgi:hypothetical protein